MPHSPNRLRLPALGLAAALACGPESPPGDETGPDSADATAATSEPTTQGTVEPACDCLAELDGRLHIDTSRCSDGPCDELELRCEGDQPNLHPFCTDGGLPVIDSQAVDCALEQLVHGTPGYIEYWETPDIGFVYAGGYLEIGAGRSGITQTYQGEDSAMTFSATEVVPLRDTSYFVACQALQSPLERYQCLKDWTGGPAITTCAPAGEPPFPL